ncbi:DoxX family protein [Streptomyces sp. NPDC088725]|uniref:DoxX family protein n=1 Tax=Streptomyces sp. NPDC088725 TaxID=3365873 RepID=UPI0037FF1E5E
MAVLRRIARPLLASSFVAGGIHTLLHPSAVAPAAGPVALPVADRIPALPKDPEQLVRINSAVQIGAGALFALGRFPRLSAFALAASLIPTTLAGHAYWTEEDPEKRSAQRVHFLKNVSLLGGLLIAVADTHGKPSLAYRSRRGLDTAVSRSADGVRSVTEAVRDHVPVT